MYILIASAVIFVAGFILFFTEDITRKTGITLMLTSLFLGFLFLGLVVPIKEIEEPVSIVSTVKTNDVTAIFIKGWNDVLALNEAKYYNAPVSSFRAIKNKTCNSYGMILRESYSVYLTNQVDQLATNQVEHLEKVEIIPLDITH